MNTSLLIGNALQTLETSSSVGMFARDTGGCLLSRLAISRSSDESREISIAEITESVLFYFSSPFLAKQSRDVFSNVLDVDKDLMTKRIDDLKNITNETKKKVKLGKFAQIFSTFGIILPLVFSIAPLRNMVTLGKTGKDKFSSVVNLDKTKHNKKKEEAKNKAKNLCKKLLAISIGTLGTVFGLLALSKNKNFYNKIEPLIDKTLKHFDFTKNCDLELKHYGALIYPVSIASYFYASRDKYEIMENARRFSFTVPLLFFGEKLIQNPIYKFADKTFGANIFDKGNIKTYDDIKKMAQPVQKQALKSKNLAYGLTFFINTIAIAAGVALLNRFETQRIYNQEHVKGNHQNLYKHTRSSLWDDMKI